MGVEERRVGKECNCRGILIDSEVSIEVKTERSAAQVLGGGIDEPDTDVMLSAGPAVCGRVELHARVAVFMLDGILIDTCAEDALLFGMDDNACTPVGRRSFEHIAVLVHGDPVKALAH